jgi:hypothetical protein
MNRLKLAELTSGAGALVIGVGLGALFPQWFGPIAGVITVVGLVSTPLACGTSTAWRHAIRRRTRCGSWSCTHILSTPPTRRATWFGQTVRGTR